MLMLRTSSDPTRVVFAIAAVVVVVFLLLYLQRKRTKELIVAAGNFGFMPAEELPIVCEMPIFSRNITITNIFVGNSQGYEATLFDLRVNQGKASYSQTVAGFRRPGLVIPPFQVHAKNLSDRIAAHFSSEIVPIDSDPNFSSRYVVRSVTPQECERFFTPQLLAYFTQLPHGWTVEGSGDSVIVYRHGKTVAPSKLDEFLNDAGNVAAGLLGMLHPTSVLE